jgi:hypothetical protein
MGADLVKELRPELFGEEGDGLERESYAEWLGLGQLFHNRYI